MPRHIYEELTEALSDIEVLRAEVERLKADNQKLRALVQDLSATRDTAVNMKLERDAEIERLTAKIAYVRQRSQRACEILNEFDNTRPKP
jgi:FtsZ-binding cell division protein ZapB